MQSTNMSLVCLFLMLSKHLSNWCISVGSAASGVVGPVTEDVYDDSLDLENCSDTSLIVLWAHAVLKLMRY